DWAHQTVPQSNLGGRVDWMSLREGVLGGSTAMNTMYLIRPSSPEMDTWAELLDASTYNSQSMHTAMHKSETFIPPLIEPQRVGNIQYDVRIM
ncbi:hypothetical protein BDQ17DRAFT_1261864, partial [Cyathus striatus]